MFPLTKVLISSVITKSKVSVFARPKVPRPCEAFSKKPFALHFNKANNAVAIPPLGS